MVRSLIVLLLFCALTFAAEMKVTASVLNVRSGPSTSYNVVSTLKKGAIVNTSDQKNGWYKIGSNKWVSGSYLTPTSSSSSSSSETKCVTASALNVRSGPGTNYSKVDSKKNGDKVTVYEYNSGKSWARIGTNKWVSAEYLGKCGSDGGSQTVVTTGAKCNLVNGNVIDTSKPFTTGKKYGYSDDDLKHLAYVGMREQGSVSGAKIEMTLMINLY